MAKVKRGGMLFGLSGKLGNFVFSQMQDGSTRISVKPDSRRRKGTQGQKDNRQGFGDAARRASAAAKNYPIYAELARERPMVNAYNIALADARKPPVIHCVERVEGVIHVQASDNVMVANVFVEIRDADGKLIEQDIAIRVDEEWWEYTPKKQGTVMAVAHDLPWNETRVAL